MRKLLIVLGSIAAGEMEPEKSYLSEEFKSSTSDDELMAFLDFNVRPVEQ